MSKEEKHSATTGHNFYVKAERETLQTQNVPVTCEISFLNKTGGHALWMTPFNPTVSTLVIISVLVIGGGAAQPAIQK